MKTTKILTGLLILITASPLSAKRATHTTAFSETSPTYQRIKLPSGKFKPESYVFAEGQKMDKQGGDDSLSTLDFSGVAHILSNALLEADYVPTRNLDETNLLIVIHWGKTLPADTGMSTFTTDQIGSTMNQISQLDNMGGQQTFESRALGLNMQSYFESQLDVLMTMQRMFDQIRDEQNAYNAQLLGYTGDLISNKIIGQTVMTMQHRHNNLMSELETARYFVILQAYDFQKFRRDKTKDMLWSARFSIQAKGRRFDEELFDMALAASRVLGTDTRNLKRHLTPTRVEFGDIEYIGVEEK